MNSSLWARPMSEESSRCACPNCDEAQTLESIQQQAHDLLLRKYERERRARQRSQQAAKLSQAASPSVGGGISLNAGAGSGGVWARGIDNTATYAQSSAETCIGCGSVYDPDFDEKRVAALELLEKRKNEFYSPLERLAQVSEE